MSANDTIAAIATPAGRGAVGIVRLSGADVPRIARAMLGGVPVARRARHTNFLDASRYGGAHFVYFGSYGPEFPSRSAGELLDEFGPHIRTLNPAFEPSIRSSGVM